MPPKNQVYVEGVNDQRSRLSLGAPADSLTDHISLTLYNP